MTYRFSPRKNIFDGIFVYVNRVSISEQSELISINGSKNFVYTVENTGIHDFFSPHEKTYIVIEQNYSWLSFTFNTININITGYSIKSTNVSTRTIRDWTLEAKNNDSDWVLLHNMTNYNDFMTNDSKYFSVENGVYNSFKLTKLNINSDNTGFFDLHGFEVFGQICNPVNCDILPDCPFSIQNHFIYKFNHFIFHICSIFLIA